MSDVVDLAQAERLAAEFWTEPGDQQAARTFLVALVGRVRALTEAGNTLATAVDESLPYYPDPRDPYHTAVDPADVAVWRALVAP